MPWRRPGLTASWSSTCGAPAPMFADARSWTPCFRKSEPAMSQPPLVLEALRLPELYRRVCLHAGLPLPTAPGGPVERFVVRCGDEPPTILAGLLEEALLEDRAEVTVLPAGGPPDYGSLP